MDSKDLNEYRKIIKEILIEYSKFKPAYGDIETDVVFDDERNHYQMVHIGWKNDGTENGIAEELVESGITREQIVLGFRSPSLRKYTQYAVE